VAARRFCGKVAQSLSANYSQVLPVKNLRKTPFSEELLAGVDNDPIVSGRDGQMFTKARSAAPGYLFYAAVSAARASSVAPVFSRK
jgi:hypothetical protein